MDFYYDYAEEDGLSAQEQEKIKVLSRVAGGFIIAAWLFLGALTLACCCVSLLACIKYSRIKRLQRKVTDQEDGITKIDKQF